MAPVPPRRSAPGGSSRTTWDSARRSPRSPSSFVLQGDRGGSAVARRLPDVGRDQLGSGGRPLHARATREPLPRPSPRPSRHRDRRRGRRRNDLRAPPARRRLAREDTLPLRRSRRSAKHQERRQRHDASRESPRRLDAPRPLRHADRKPAPRALVPRLLREPGHPRHLARVRDPLRAPDLHRPREPARGRAARHRAPVPPAPDQGRRPPRAPAEDGDRPRRHPQERGQANVRRPRALAPGRPGEGYRQAWRDRFAQRLHRPHAPAAR